MFGIFPEGKRCKNGECVNPKKRGSFFRVKNRSACSSGCDYLSRCEKVDSKASKKSCCWANDVFR
ncbi:hypothetical protein [Aeribacillus composti]|uniref:hypothetical protein n=1 Tax=Aeribacillus composti TaxID=1868734 RepID=UPI003D1FF06A